MSEIALPVELTDDEIAQVSGGVTQVGLVNANNVLNDVLNNNNILNNNHVDVAIAVLGVGVA